MFLISVLFRYIKYCFNVHDPKNSLRRDAAEKGPTTQRIFFQVHAASVIMRSCSLLSIAVVRYCIGRCSGNCRDIDAKQQRDTRHMVSRVDAITSCASPTFTQLSSQHEAGESPEILELRKLYQSRSQRKRSKKKEEESARIVYAYVEA